MMFVYISRPGVLSSRLWGSLVARSYVGKASLHQLTYGVQCSSPFFFATVDIPAMKRTVWVGLG